MYITTRMFQQLIPLNALGLYFPPGVAELIGEYDGDFYGVKRIKTWKHRLLTEHDQKVEAMAKQLDKDIGNLRDLEKYAGTQEQRKLHMVKKREAWDFIKTCGPAINRTTAQRRMEALKLLGDPKYDQAKREYDGFVSADIKKVGELIIEKFGITNRGAKSDDYSIYIPVRRDIGYSPELCIYHSLVEKVKNIHNKGMVVSLKGRVMADLRPSENVVINTPKGVVVKTILFLNFEKLFDLSKIEIEARFGPGVTKPYWQIKGGMLALCDNLHHAKHDAN